MAALTVTQLVIAVNSALTTLDSVEVEGEIDEFKIVHNKWVTFRLKDAESSVGCFMTVWQYRTVVEDGMLVRARGKPTLRNKGFFSFVISSIQPSGEGALKRAFELLRQKLTSEGLFAPERKRALPRFPQHIALITSREAAAYHDFLKVLQARQGGLVIYFIHTQVQGEDAPRQLVAALDQANTLADSVDMIVLVRGGGSLEDLRAFNDEMVVRTVAASRTPTIVGVGHERDITLAELAADVRASTPSNAAELLVRSRQETSLAVARMAQQLTQAVAGQRQAVDSAISRAVTVLRAQITLPRQNVARALERLAGSRARWHQITVHRAHELSRLQSALHQRTSERTRQSRERLAQLSRVLSSFSPEKTLRRGYSITRTEHGGIVKTAAALKLGQEIETQFAHGKTKSRVLGSDSQKTLI